MQITYSYLVCIPQHWELGFSWSPDKNFSDRWWLGANGKQVTYPEMANTDIGFTDYESAQTAYVKWSTHRDGSAKFHSDVHIVVQATVHYQSGWEVYTGQDKGD